jgi:hypothetical protein
MTAADPLLLEDCFSQDAKHRFQATVRLVMNSNGR